MKSTVLRIPSAISFALWAVITNCEARADAEAESAAGASVLQEVTVTAQRREESISRVPISISAFTQADLDARDMKTLGDIASVTPGVDFRPVGYSNWFTIRGISQNAGGGVAGLGPNTTALYVDDAPLQARYANAAVPTAVPYVFDIDHIEVLRGPQGTVFGASAEGGAIRVISTAPSLTEFSGHMRAEGSLIDGGGINSEFGAAVGGPIIQDRLGFRASAWTQHDGGFVDQNPALLGQPPANSIPRGQVPGNLLPAIIGGQGGTNVNKGDTYSARVALLWKPIDALSIEPSIYYQKRDQNSADLFDPTIGDPSKGRFVSSRILNQPIYDSFYTPSLKLVFDMGWAQVTSLSSNLRRVDSQGYDYTLVLPPAFGWLLPTTAADAEPVIVGTNQSNFTQEVRLQSPNSSEHFHWTLGLYYSNLHQHDYETAAGPTYPQMTLANTGKTMEEFFGEGLVHGDLTYISDQFIVDKQKAVFANADYDLGKHFSVFGGVRYEKQENTYRTVSDGALAGGPSDITAASKGQVTSPKGGLNWKIDDLTLVYFSAAKGYRPGGAGIPVHLNTQECTDQLNQLGGGANYEADTLWSYELGLKTQLLDRRLSIEGSVYHIDWSNIISAVHVPLCATHISKNLGDAKSDGFDLSVKALVTQGLTAGLSVGYTNARYSSDSEIFGETLARAGQAISDVAPWNVTAEVAYQTPLTDKIMGYGRLEDRYTSRNNRLVPAEDSTTVTYDPFITTNPSVNLLNGRIGVRFGDGSDLALVATNLLNTHPVLNEQIFLINITSGAFTVRPRTVGLAYSYHW
ncbi:MAG: TonB-dependent receptor [Proteobacteria bacterium]|nr:TonB-dependent receptor [Pseudomonadota bacterium]